LLVWVLSLCLQVMLSGNMFWGRTLAHWFTAPYGELNFRTNLVGDIMASLVKVLIDLAYSVCWV
jgi:hypothetical protein